MVRCACSNLNLRTIGIVPDLTNEHSLWTRVKMALKLHGYSETTICKLGSWMYKTFNKYIHNQVSCSPLYLSEK